MILRHKTTGKEYTVKPGNYEKLVQRGAISRYDVLPEAKPAKKEAQPKATQEENLQAETKTPDLNTDDNTGIGG